MIKKMWSRLVPSCFRSITDARHTQLQEEAHLDAVLYQCNTDCPLAVANYLLEMRRLNRHLYSQTYGAAFYNYPALCHSNMQILDAHQRPLLNNDPKTLCSLLPAMTGSIQKRLSSKPDLEKIDTK